MSPYRTISRSRVRGPQRSRRSLPRSASMRRQCVRSAAGCKVVSSRTIWFKYGGCATGPRGAVSSTRDAATSRVPGSAPSRARAYARCAARSPRLLPRATKARSIDVGEPARQVTQHRGHLFQVPGRALEVGEPLGRLNRARRYVVGFDAVLARNGRHGVDALAQPRERQILLAGGRGDAARVRGGFRRGRDDRVERFERRRRKLLDAADVDLAAAHLLDDFADLGMDVLNQVAGFRRRIRALLGEAAHFVGHHAEALAVFAGARRLDGGIERQEIRHVRELADGGDEARDAAAHLTELLDLDRALAHEGFERDESLDGFADLRAIADGDVAGRRGGAGGACAVIGDPARDLREALRRL